MRQRREADVNVVGRDHEHLPVVFLMGPTAAGKTQLAMELAQRLALRIISVDSAMVYRGLDIGTGKPDKATLQRFPHALIDIRDPEQTYSADEFRRDALEAIATAHGEGTIPLLVGGTGLYFRALRQGLSVLPSANRTLRARLAAEAAEQGWGTLHARLARVDPGSAARIHANDPQRIQRALEVYELCGTPMSQLLSCAPRAALSNPVHTLIIEPRERAKLHAAIAVRFDAMLSAGLVDEVGVLRRRYPLSEDLPCMRAVGYRQVSDYLAQACDYDQMVTRAVAATRQLARRQLTWLRSESCVARLDCHSKDLLNAALGALAGAIPGQM